MIIQPIPNVKITEKDSITSPWRIWFRNLSQNMIDACIINSNSIFKWSVNSNLLTIIYSGNGNVDLSLPYQIAVDCFLTYYEQIDGAWFPKIIDLQKGQTIITIPSGIIKIKDNVLIEQKNR